MEEKTVEIEIHAKEIINIPTAELKEHPKNPNKHSKEQIEQMCIVIKGNGFRDPLTMSNLSGYVLDGCGRIQAAKILGMKELPVIKEDYENEDMEYADMVARNALNHQSELDFPMINMEMENLGPDFDIDMLGLKDFKLDVSEFDIEDKKEKETGAEKIDTPHKCPSCGYEWYTRGQNV
jgi:hypothetical protein